eukprot:15144222-Alexandrium_andersonii.AAC.1
MNAILNASSRRFWKKYEDRAPPDRARHYSFQGPCQVARATSKLSATAPQPEFEVRQPESTVICWPLSE